MLSVIITLLADGFNVAPTRLPGSPDQPRPPRQDCQGTPCAYIPLDDVDPRFLAGGQPKPPSSVWSLSAAPVSVVSSALAERASLDVSHGLQGGDRRLDRYRAGHGRASCHRHLAHGLACLIEAAFDHATVPRIASPIEPPTCPPNVEQLEATPVSCSRTLVSETSDTGTNSKHHGGGK